MPTQNDNLNILKDATGDWFLIGLKDNCVVCIDGGHSDIEGVTKALKLHKAIFGEKRYEGVTWKAALFSGVPAIDVLINEEAAASCRQMVDVYQRRKP